MLPLKWAIEMGRDEWAAYIDHSVLKPKFTRNEFKVQIQKGIG